MIRVHAWSEEQLRQRESVFEALTAKALRGSVRALTANLHGVLTAAGERASGEATPPPVVPLPAVSPVPQQSTQTITTADMAVVLATWQGYVDTELFPYAVDTFVDSAEHTAKAVENALGTTVQSLTEDYAITYLAGVKNRLVGVSNTVWNKLSETLGEGYAAGEGIQQLAARIKTVANLATPRALTVARTEVISAANAGSLQQVLDAGFTDDECEKEWLATEDAKTRPAHRAADGQRVPITQNFTVDGEGLQFPGAPTGSPGNVINCRCSLAYSFADDAASALETSEPALVAAGDFIESEHPRDPSDGKFVKNPVAAVAGVADLLGQPLHINTKVIYTTKYEHNAVVARKQWSNGSYFELTWDANVKKFRQQQFTPDGKPTGSPTLYGKGEAYQKFSKETGWHAPKDPAAEAALVAKFKAAGPPVVKVMNEVGAPATLKPATAAKVAGPDDLLDTTNFKDGQVVAVFSPYADQVQRLRYDASTDSFHVQRVESGAWVTLATLSPTEAKTLATKTNTSMGWVYNFEPGKRGAITPGGPKISPVVTTGQVPKVAQGESGGFTSVTAGSPLTKEALQREYTDGQLVATHPGGFGQFEKKMTWDSASKSYVIEYKKNGKWEPFEVVSPQVAVEEYADKSSWVVANTLLSPTPAPSTPAQNLHVDPAALKFTGTTLGTHGAQVWSDSTTGKKYLFKANTGAPYATEVDVATNQLHELLGLPTPKTGKVTLDGKTGSLQEMIQGPQAFPHPKSFDPTKLTPQDIVDLQREQVFDWLIGNHDAHSDNFIRFGTKNGALIGLDKGQAFKFYNADSLLNWSYQPNEHPPVYKQLWGAYASGKNINVLDPGKTNGLSKFIEKVQALPDDQVRELFRPYAERAAQAGVLGTFKHGATRSTFKPNDVDSFLDAVIARKNSLHDDFEQLFTDARAARAKKLGVAPETLGSADVPTSVGAHIPTVTPSTPGGHVPVGAGGGKPIHLNTKVIYTTKYGHGAIIAVKSDSGDIHQRLVWNANTKKFDLQVMSTFPGGDPNWKTDSSYTKTEAYKTFSQQSGWQTPTPGAHTPSAGPGDQSHAPSVSTSAPASAGGITSTAPATLTKRKPAKVVSVTEHISGGAEDISKYSVADRKGIISTYIPEGGPNLSKLPSYAAPSQVLEKVFQRLAAVNKSGKYPGVTALQMIAMIDAYKHDTQGKLIHPEHHFRDQVLDYLKTSAGKAHATKLSVKYQAAGIVSPATVKKLNLSPGAITKQALEEAAKKTAATTYSPISGKGYHHTGGPDPGTVAALADLPIASDISKPLVRPHDHKFNHVTAADLTQFNQNASATKPWTTNQKAAIKAYTGSYYSTFNSALRKGHYASPDAIEKIKHLQAAMRPLDTDVRVYRGSDSQLMTGVADASVTELKALIGKKIQDKGFFSTAINEGSAFGGGIRYVVEVPKGSAAAWVKDLSNFKSENELLLAAGTKFEVIDVTKGSTGGWSKGVVVKLRVIS